MELTDADRRKYQRQMSLAGFGEPAQQRLKNSAAPGGTGGRSGRHRGPLPGSGGHRPADAVARRQRHATNLNRQILVTADWIGKSRAEKLRSSLLAFNPDLDLTVIPEHPNDANLGEHVARVDVLCDCPPTFEERFAMNRASVRHRKPMIEAAMNGMEGHLTVLVPGRTPCLQCLYPEPPPDWSGTAFPVLGAVSGAVGCLAAIEAIKMLTGFGKPLAGSVCWFSTRNATNIANTRCIATPTARCAANCDRKERDQCYRSRRAGCVSPTERTARRQLQVSQGAYAPARLIFVHGLSSCRLRCPAPACSVPVFRYALERWPADHYELVVFHRGPLERPEQALVARLEKAGADKDALANLQVLSVNLDEPSEKPLADLWAAQKNATLPWMVLRLPRIAKKQETVWAGPLNRANVDRVLDSPLRRKIAGGLLKGESAVWVFVEIGDPVKDAAGLERLQKHLKKLQGTLKLPELRENNPEDRIERGPGAPELKVAFSVLRLSRADPKEAVLLQMLLNTEDDLKTHEGTDGPSGFRAGAGLVRPGG